MRRLLKKAPVIKPLNASEPLYAILSESFYFDSGKDQFMKKFSLAIHGGADPVLKKKMTPERDKEFRNALTASLSAGYAILKSGGSSLDAVQAAVMALEDSPLFNAGRGSAFNHEGKNEMDASVMDGRTLKAGAVTGVRTIKNPVTAARAVMEKSKHVMLVGAGAEEFARLQKIETADPSYFFDQERWDELQEVKELEQNDQNSDSVLFGFKKLGTVGAVALDQDGNLAAATSTGGTTNKRFGRVGDSPIIGCGTYANNNTCAISCTGHGEYFIRWTAAHDVSCLVEYKGLSLQEAANEVVMKKLFKAGGEGGLIAVDKHGNIAMPYNSVGMLRGFVKETGDMVVEIY
jgi:beta-aspartyl-peptidase (threonine type)